MWFAFGLATVVAGGAITAWRRRASDWSGERVGTCTQKISRGKRNVITSVRIGIPTRSTLDFDCKPENAFDRVCKQIGLVREHQTGHRAFDRKLYVISDDRRVGAALRHSQALADDLLSLFSVGDGRFRAKRVTCRGGRLWVDFDACGSPEDAAGLAEACAPVLERTAAALPAGAAVIEGGDRRLTRSVVVLAVSSGLAISGALQLLHARWDGAMVVDATTLHHYTAMLGGALLVAMCVLAFALLAKSSRLHLVLAEVLLVGGFGAFAIAYTELRQFNIEFDAGDVQQLEASVVDRRVSHGRRGRRTYYITVTDWNGTGRTMEGQVPKHMHDALDAGDVIRIRQHPGRLGVRWAEDFADANR